jgi:DNA (cytosine-5)-methyltransferase 1
MRHGSLFSGIGGFDLAAEWCGWENVFHCEWNTFGQKVLKHHFPKSISYNDITKTDFTIHRRHIDIISGGFPCQPYSSAGKRLGKEDERHLWPEMLRAIREIQPSWVVGENVRGLTNWNGGLVFDEVQSDLEAQGYEVLPFLLPAAALNAPHRRDRIWFIAYSNSYGSNKRNSAYEIATTNERLDALSNTNKSDGNGVTTDSNTTRIHEQHITAKSNEKKQYSRSSFEARCFSTFPTEPPICGADDGLSKELDGITFSKWRNESLKAYGNAIVPQVAYQIFKSISLYQEV